jgi:hypothetical protein
MNSLVTQPFSVYNNRYLLFLFCLSFFTAKSALPVDSLSSMPSAAVYAYLQLNGKKIDTVYRSLYCSANEAIITYDDPPNINSFIRCDETLNIRSWHHQNKETGYDITIKRSGDTLVKTGTKGKKTIQKSQVIDSAPWYQAMEFSLLSFLKQDGSSCEFWMVRPTDMNAFKMVAHRKDVETIQVNGHSEKAVKVTLSPAGLIGRFWKAACWYRVSDFTFLKSSLPQGLPGSSALIVELIDKKHL